MTLMSKFSLLPEEVIVEALENVDFKTIISCQLTSRDLKAVVAHSMSLRYKLALAAVGMCDGLYRSLSTVEGLERLRTYQSNFGVSPWIKREVLPLFTALPSNDIVSGALLAHPLPNRPGFALHQMPSVLRGIKERRWEIDVGSKFRVVCMDSSQDLLVQVEDASRAQPLSCFHLRSLSTGEVHPSSRSNGTIPMGHQPARIGMTSVYGDYLAKVLLHSVSASLPTDRQVLCIWNWRTGVVELEQPLQPLSGRDWPTFAFLDERRIVVLQGSLSGTLHPLSLQVFEFRTNTSHATDCRASQPSHIFWLPQFEKTAPVKVGIMPSRPTTGQQSRGHFYSDPADQLLATQMTFTQPHRDFALYVPTRTLLALMRALPTTSNGTPVTVPWGVWGPSGSRLEEIRPRSEPVPSVLISGMRTLSLVHDACDDSRKLLVSDYHPRRSLMWDEDGPWRLAADEVDVEAQPFSMTSSLPCFVKEIPLPKELSLVQDE
ncbi:hypothetical protein BV25DRAFT_1996329, partial [Artomyces pyxidatus]